MVICNGGFQECAQQSSIIEFRPVWQIELTGILCHPTVVEMAQFPEPHCVSSPSPFFLKSMLFVVLTIFTELDPMRRAADGPRLIHAAHSLQAISTRFGRLLRPSTGRSVILMWCRRRASCITVCTVGRHTPARPAILSIGLWPPSNPHH